MVPKDVKRRFKGIFSNRDGSDPNSNNSNESRSSGDPEAHSPVTYSAKKDDNAVDDTALIPREENKQSDDAHDNGLQNVTNYFKNGVRQVSDGVANGAKVLKERVVGKSAKRATLVEDDEDVDEDPCSYA